MLYELTHYIKAHFGFVWKIIEWGNASVFGLLYNKKLRQIHSIVKRESNTFTVSEVCIQDVEKLSFFFSEQPEESFTFFNPHGFDSKSLSELVRRKSFLMFKVTDKESIVGYFFLRCFANGNAFKGRMVDYRRRNQGIAKLMGNVINDIVISLGFKLFTTISPDNYSSLASTKAVNDIKIVRVLENGYYYIECTPKKEKG